MHKSHDQHRTNGSDGQSQHSIAFVIPGAQKLINTAIEADLLILSYSIETQLAKLVFKPLQLLTDQGHFVNRPFPQLVITDGLVECLDKMPKPI